MRGLIAAFSPQNAACAQVINGKTKRKPHQNGVKKT